MIIIGLIGEGRLEPHCVGTQSRSTKDAGNCHRRRWGRGGVEMGGVHPSPVDYRSLG